MKKLEIEDQILQMKGNTLKIYYFLLLQEKPIGVREIQRELKISSPSVVSHHLNKLINWGLIDRTIENKYFVRRRVKVGILRQFVRVYHKFVPRYAIYAGFFVGLLVFYLALSFIIENTLFDKIIALITLGCSIIMCSFETINMMRALEEIGG